MNIVFVKLTLGIYTQLKQAHVKTPIIVQYTVYKLFLTFIMDILLLCFYVGQKCTCPCQFALCKEIVTIKGRTCM